MKLLVGLGNPGAAYENTRHNFGFMVIDHLATDQGVRFKNDAAFRGLVAVYAHPVHEKVFLLKPQTFMNLSGESVAACSRFYKISPENVLVIHDEIDLPFGRVRFAARGSPAGHNGLKSIIQHLGTQDFHRLKMGVGRPTDPHYPVADWVLRDFPPADHVPLRQVIERTGEMLGAYLDDGLEKAMNQWNGWALVAS